MYEDLPMKKVCTILHISCKMCKFLALLILQAKNHVYFLLQLSCKIKLLHISCTCYFARWKSCKFLAPDILQNENLASFLCQIFYKMRIVQVSCTSDNVGENLASFLHKHLCWNSCKILHHRHAYTCTLSWSSFTLQGLTSCNTCILDSYRQGSQMYILIQYESMLTLWVV